MALSLRAILILRAAFCTRIVIFIAAGEQTGEFNLLKFHGRAGFSEAKHRPDLRRFKFEDEKFHKAAE